LRTVKAQLLSPGHAFNAARLVGHLTDKVWLKRAEVGDPARSNAIAVLGHDLNLKVAGTGGWLGGQGQKFARACLSLAIGGDDFMGIDCPRLPPGGG
jgi:hypothetical protein